MLTQQIVSGLAAGSLYALAALGLVLIYSERLTRNGRVIIFLHSGEE